MLIFIREAKQINGLKLREEELLVVPLKNGTPPTGPFPTIEQLLVAGNEKLPSTNRINPWNAKRSLDLIRQYDSGYYTEDEEATSTSRRRRITLGKYLGITPSQFNIAAQQIFG